jgi:hypothetical protein
MWIYYYASFGPGHQSNDHGYRYFSDNYDREMIKENLFRLLCDYYDIVLNFWEVERPHSAYIERETKGTKSTIKNLQAYLKVLEAESCFVSAEKEGKDAVLIRNLSNCIETNLLKRLHKAGFMYRAEDIHNWRYGKKCLTEPSRSKILNIMRRCKKYGK